MLRFAVPSPVDPHARYIYIHIYIYDRRDRIIQRHEIHSNNNTLIVKTIERCLFRWRKRDVRITLYILAPFPGLTIRIGLAQGNDREPSLVDRKRESATKMTIQCIRMLVMVVLWWASFLMSPWHAAHKFASVNSISQCGLLCYVHWRIQGGTRGHVPLRSFRSQNMKFSNISWNIHKRFHILYK